MHVTPSKHLTRVNRPPYAAPWWLWSAAALVCVAVTSGCTRFDLSKNIPWASHDDQPQAPTRITAIWTDTVLSQPNQPAVRGFGGRLMFYTADDEESIRVDGTLTVYAYDDTGKESPETEPGVPTRKYVFPSQYLSKHYSKSSLGNSYSFWLPWDKIGGPQRNVSLITRFEAVSGEVVRSSITHQLLPGSTPTPKALAKKTPQPVPTSRDTEESAAEADTTGSGERQVAHVEPAESQPAKASLETSTITVPAGFLRGRGARDRTGSDSPDQPSQVIRRQSESGPAPVLPRIGSPPKTSPSEAASGPNANAALQGRAPAGVSTSELSARFAPVQLPAPSPPRARPFRRTVRRRPRPAGWPSRLPPTPRPDHTELSREIAPTGFPVVDLPSQVLDR